MLHHNAMVTPVPIPSRCPPPALSGCCSAGGVAALVWLGVAWAMAA